MDDLISRQAVLNTLFYKSDNNCEVVLNKELQDRIKALPSVTPARKKGKWVEHSDKGYVECSECGSCTNCDGNINNLHFCFSCGAKMDEDGRTLKYSLKYSDQNTMMSAT